MNLSHFLMMVERFEIDRTEFGRFGDDIRLGGWCLSRCPVTAIRLRFGGERPVSFEVRHRSETSEDLFAMFGQVFGEQARQARFSLVEKLPPFELDFASASIEAVAADGSMMSHRPGAPAGLEAAGGQDRAASDLVMRFESCGDTCEFGLVQRTLGTERMGLMRYAGCADPFALAGAIERGFDGFAEGDDLAISTFGTEWIANVRSAAIAVHTGRTSGDIGEAEILVEERRKLQFLASKFLEDLGAGEKIFVYRTMRDERGGPDGTRGMEALHRAMRRIGPARLLWVNEADADHPPAQIRTVGDGLFRGFVARLAPHSNAFDTDPLAWLETLRAACAVIDA